MSAHQTNNLNVSDKGISYVGENKYIVEVEVTDTKSPANTIARFWIPVVITDRGTPGELANKAKEQALRRVKSLDLDSLI